MDPETEKLQQAVLAGERLGREAGVYLAKDAPFTDLLYLANRIRQAKMGDAVALCAIINARSGSCSEDCAFCAQSGHHQTSVATYPMKPADELVAAAKKAEQAGADSFCIVTSGRGPEGDGFDELLDRVRRWVGFSSQAEERRVVVSRWLAGRTDRSPGLDVHQRGRSAHWPLHAHPLATHQRWTGQLVTLGRLRDGLQETSWRRALACRDRPGHGSRNHRRYQAH